MSAVHDASRICTELAARSLSKLFSSCKSRDSRASTIFMRQCSVCKAPLGSPTRSETCPGCGAQMRVIALIEEPEVEKAILSHVGRWNPQPGDAAERSPPLATEAWPAHASLALTYHPVPDIA